MALFDATNLDPDLVVAYELKEAFRVAMAIGRSGDTTTFVACMDRWTLCAAPRASTRSPRWPRPSGTGAPRSSTTPLSGGASNGFAESLNYLIKNQKRQAQGYRTWAGFRGQMLWTFDEAVDPDTGVIKPLRSVPRGMGANWSQTPIHVDPVSIAALMLSAAGVAGMTVLTAAPASAGAQDTTLTCSPKTTASGQTCSSALPPTPTASRPSS